MSSSIGDTINELSLELSKVQGEIEKVEGEIARVATKIENEEHLLPDEKSFWMYEKRQLRDKEKQLRDEKKLLMQKEMQLRASGEGGRPPTNQAQDDDIRGTLKRVEQKLDDSATVSVEMSAANGDFTRELLGAKGIVFKVLPICTEVLDDAFSDRFYKWEEWEDEKDGQQGCKAMLERELLPLSLDGRALGVFDVRGLLLPEVYGGNRRSKGCSDLAIGDLESLTLPDTRDLTFGLSPALIELKTAKAALKQGQLLLQLVSLSAISNARRGAIVLGTDCATKWRLVYFTKFDEITIQQYTCGKKCLVDFSLLIQGSAEKGQSLVASPLPSIAETEFPEDGEDSAQTSAYLNAVAHHLAGLFPSERETLVPTVDENRNPPPMIYL